MRETPGGSEQGKLRAGVVRKEKIFIRSEIMREIKITEEDLKKYEGKYDRKLSFKLLKKLRQKTRQKPKLLSKPVGFVVQALGHFLSALDNPSLPLVQKAKIIAVIAYIVSPIDLIPDAIPIVGWADDAAAAKLFIDTIKRYSTFSMQELDDEIDGIVRAPASSKNEGAQCETRLPPAVIVEDETPHEIQETIESIEQQGAEEETTRTYQSRTLPFDELVRGLEEGNKLFQQFLDKSAELDTEFSKIQEESKSSSSDMWDAISKI